MVIILITVLAIILLLIISLYAIFLSAFGTVHKTYNPKYTLPRSSQFDSVRAAIKERVALLDKLDHEGVSTYSHDKLKLFAHLYDGTRKDTVILQMHGYRGHGIKDFCGSSFYWLDRGYTVLVPDQRAHGKSEGRALSFGINERYDVLSWVNFITEKYGNGVKIILSGISMGAATVLMASGLDLPKNVIGVIADCPYSSPKEIIIKVAKERGFAPKIFYPIIRLSAIIFGGFDVEKASPMQALKTAKLPILFIHGDKDRFVPYEMGKALYDSYSGQKRLVTVIGAGHAFSYFFNKEQYEKALDEYIALIGNK